MILCIISYFNWGNQKIAKNDAEGIEHHVSKETLKVFENFIKQND